MLIRVRSKDGNFRFEVNSRDDASVLLNKILESAKNADPDSVTVSQQPRGGETVLKTLFGRDLASLGLSHGDLLFVSYKSGDATVPISTPVAVQPQPSSESSVSGPSGLTTASGASQPRRPWEIVQEDPVDTYWRQRDGKIPRKRDPNFCRHGFNGMCDYCMPLEPFDAKYQAEHSIKHLSFHAYLRQLAPQQAAPSTNASVNGGGATPSSALPPLSPFNYKVKIPCPSESHLPYPAGICSACQPSAITLSRQTWRATDHVEIASPSIIDGFLGSWRQSGRQRFGWMLGTYKPYDEVPLGVKAVVEAIHEPPQEGDLDGLSLELPWGEEGPVVELAAAAGLQIVGMIFTDLTPDPKDKSKTLCKRHGDSFFLSSLETTFAARQQLSHPLKTKSSPTGLFSSRLVTAVLCGTPDGGIDLACYAVSEQGCAMVDADMIEATVDPNTVRIKTDSEGEGRYVPDAFFTYKNEYGIQVKETAKPCFPVEYLLVNVTHGFPTNPNPIFRTPNPFTIENREPVEKQRPDLVFSQLSQMGAPNLRAAKRDKVDVRASVAHYLSDWHLLAFLPSINILSDEDMHIIAKIATAPDLNDLDVLGPLLVRDGWQTLMAIVEDHGSSRPPARPITSAPQQQQPSLTDDGFVIPPDDFPPAGAVGGGGSLATVTCPHCTFENPPGMRDCEVCGLPM